MLFSVLIVGGLAGLARYFFGKQSWWVGVLFFLLSYPVAVVMLFAWYKRGSGAVQGAIGSAGSHAFFGALIGAILLSAQSVRSWS